MAVDTEKNSQCGSTRFAALLRAERGSILAKFARRMEHGQDSACVDLGARSQMVAIAAGILAEIATRLGYDGAEACGRMVQNDRSDVAIASKNLPSPAELLVVGAALFDVAVSSLGRHVAADPGLLPGFVATVLALNEGTGRLAREASGSNTGYMLERIDRAHTDERLRIARDLHDRVGEGLSIALRQVELIQIESGQSPASSIRRAASAEESIVQAMARLRGVAAGLRQEPGRSLEAELVGYIGSFAADGEVRLLVSGDQGWVPLTVIDEAHQIIREALRNAFSHGCPRLVQVVVTIAPHELSAWVDDDGGGFDMTAPAAAAGQGLTSMRERAALVGGRLTLASTPGRGTYVGLIVPLAGRLDERQA